MERAPIQIIAATVIVLAVFGSCSVQQSMGYAYVMLTLGIGMFCLEKLGFSAAPLVLGLILGPIAEAIFIQVSMIATAQNGPREYFLGGTLNVVLILMAIGSVGYSYWSNKTMPKQTGQTA